MKAHLSDHFERLSLAATGIAERDYRVFAFARARGVPVAVAMGGGYCPQVDKVVAIHPGTVCIAAALRIGPVPDARSPDAQPPDA